VSAASITTTRRVGNSVMRATSVRSVSIDMKMLLVGALGMLALQVLLLVGAYMLRMTPEVVNCDMGRESVLVQVDKAIRVYVTHLDVYEIGECKLWFHS
jgi:hypothetical protein